MLSRISFTITFISVFAVESLSQPQCIVDKKLITAYINANSESKEKTAKSLVKNNICFDSLYLTLKEGKNYSTNVQKGFFEHNFINKIGIEHPYQVFIPYKYDPKKKYQVRLFLHGGVSSFDMRKVISLLNTSDTAWKSVNSICLFPSSWNLSKWWGYNQYENLSELLHFIKSNYNINENDVYITGVSDGGSGIYYLSNFYQTPFSCFLPFIGGMRMLTVIPKKQFYIRNYQGTSFFIVDGRKDELFDIATEISIVNELKKNAKEVTFFVVDSSKHSTNWYPVLKDTIKRFIASHKRNPFPDNVYYATEKPDTFNRKFWVIIDKIGKTKGETLTDSNTVFLDNQKIALFPRNKPFGQIEVKKIGNEVQVKVQDVKRYTLLISPDHFDLSKPIVVYTNNTLSFEGIIPKDIKTLLKYNAIDNDRTMLFASEITIVVGKNNSKKQP